MTTPSGPTCPVPIGEYETVQLAHGGGGRLMQQLIEKVFAPSFRGPYLQTDHDSAVVGVGGVTLAMTTDSFVVQPLFFPGGDIGHLAVNGTVNDLAMAGAQPLYITAAFVIEEGLPIVQLHKIAQSMQEACNAAGVHLVTGDTKVVDKGKGDGVFITTAGVGLVPEGMSIGPKMVRAGDVIIVSGDIARHGMAVLSKREGLAFESDILSDTAALNGLTAAVLSKNPVHCMRDCTRGGLATSLCEIAQSAGVDMLIDEAAVPIEESVSSACELLGFDPLYVANEGRCVLFVPQDAAETALSVMRNHPFGRRAAVIGQVTAEGHGVVEATSPIGTRRVLDVLSGEQLPRIC